ncbi:hypothetical protein PMI37_05663 [Pseudomonas sp. GM80]|nr:hypothetical protein PMI37_05663 [Pseudomonas sp. GM80]
MSGQGGNHLSRFKALYVAALMPRCHGGLY